MAVTRKRIGKAGKRVRNLRAKGVSTKQLKAVKGGVIAIISPQKPIAGELLPYIEQDNLYKR